MARHVERVPAQPFIDWLEQRLACYEAYEHCPSHPVSPRPSTGPLAKLAEECGWGTGDAGIRKLYRFRHSLKSGLVDGEKKDTRTDTFARDIVEDALHHAGVPFVLVYPGLDDGLEPRSAWCIRCGEETLRDAEGDCQWCAGEREFKAQLEKRARDRATAAARKARKLAA